MADEKTVYALKAGVKLKDGSTRFLNRGDTVPEDADKDSVARLERLGTFTPPPEPIPAPVEPLDDYSEFVANSSPKEVKAKADEEPALAADLLAAEQANKNRKSVVEYLEDKVAALDAADPSVPPPPPA